MTTGGRRERSVSRVALARLAIEHALQQVGHIVVVEIGTHAHGDDGDLALILVVKDDGIVVETVPAELHLDLAGQLVERLDHLEAVRNHALADCLRHGLEDVGAAHGLATHQLLDEVGDAVVRRFDERLPIGGHADIATRRVVTELVVQRDNDGLVGQMQIPRERTALLLGSGELGFEVCDFGVDRLRFADHLAALQPQTANVLRHFAEHVGSFGCRFGRADEVARRIRAKGIADTGHESLQFAQGPVPFPLPAELPNAPLYHDKLYVSIVLVRARIAQ